MTRYGAFHLFSASALGALLAIAAGGCHDVDASDTSDTAAVSSALAAGITISGTVTRNQAPLACVRRAAATWRRSPTLLATMR